MYHSNLFANKCSKYPILISLSLVITITSSTLAPLSGRAQSNQSPTNYANRSSSADPRQVYHGAQCSILKQPVELPDLPRYTARAYFLCGFDYAPDPMSKQRSIQLKYAVHEPKEAVLDWYRDALMSYGWTVTQSKSSNNELVASKAKNHCFLTVAEAKGHWFSSTITLDYKLGL